MTVGLSAHIQNGRWITVCPRELAISLTS
jgi:hypothetical protein